MIEGIIIKKLNKFEDERGWLSEIYRDDDGNFKPAMSYVSLTKPGQIRGPHEHVNQSDYFVFLGPGSFELHLWDKRPSSAPLSGATAGKNNYMKINVGEDEPTSVIVPPGIVHGYKCVSDIPGLCINLPDKLYKGENKSGEVDEIRWEDDENSPYKIV